MPTCYHRVQIWLICLLPSASFHGQSKYSSVLVLQIKDIFVYTYHAFVLETYPIGSKWNTNWKLWFLDYWWALSNQNVNSSKRETTEWGTVGNSHQLCIVSLNSNFVYGSYPFRILAGRHAILVDIRNFPQSFEENVRVALWIGPMPPHLGRYYDDVKIINLYHLIISFHMILLLRMVLKHVVVHEEMLQ
jgi:hypothetical protein